MNTKRTTALCVRTLPSTVCNLQTLPPFSVPTAPNSDEVEDRLRGAFPHVPTPSQDGLIHALGRFLVSTQPRCCLVVRGYAGTGKTTTMAALVQVLRDLRRPVELLAPTGRAAQVMGRYAGLQASTIHRRIYLRKATPDGGTSASIAPYARKGAVFIVDEASMIGRDSGLRQTGAAGAGFGQRDLLSDLFQFCLQAPGSRIILVGDDAQLPPVGSAISPALDGPRLAREFDLTLAERSLDDVVRQELDSGILANAHALRQDIALAKDLPEDVKAPLPQFSTEAFSDLHIVTGNDLAELLDDLHHRHGDQDVVIITRSNKRANDFNEQIRRRILWREEELDAGDRLMVVRNNYHWLKDEDAYPTDLIANGDTLVVQKIVRRYERYGLRYATADLKMEDFPNAPSFEASIMLDALHVDGPSLPGARMKALFEDVMLDHSAPRQQAQNRRSRQAGPLHPGPPGQIRLRRHRPQEPRRPMARHRRRPRLPHRGDGRPRMAPLALHRAHPRPTRSPPPQLPPPLPRRPQRGIGAALSLHLYNHWLIVDGRDVCPNGWHVPSDAEFIELEMFMGMSLETALHTRLERNRSRHPT